MRRTRCETVARAVYNKAVQLSGMFQDSPQSMGGFGVLLEVAWSEWEADFVGVARHALLDVAVVPVATPSASDSEPKKVAKKRVKRRHLPSHLRY